MHYRTMELSDYQSIIKLWTQSEGLQLRDADSIEGITKYLNRNPGLSFVCEVDGHLAGTIMCGHDGKRGYIQHLAVLKGYRKQGIGEKLMSHFLEALRQEGISKSHIHVLDNNELAKAFWVKVGWKKRTDLQVYSYINGDEKSA
ncbi:GNAT family N-acetyltransferase [Oceanospirillaceae bacterium]|nr:GNAT family N-acetyltransferase [Oceanospirillaceae bacterium]